MPNPPTPADRLAAVKACLHSVRLDTAARDCVFTWNDAELLRLLAADPPGATVERVCACEHGESEHDELDTDPAHQWCYGAVDTLSGQCPCKQFTPTDALVSFKRPLTKEERTR